MRLRFLVATKSLGMAKGESRAVRETRETDEEWGWQFRDRSACWRSWRRGKRGLETELARTGCWTRRTFSCASGTAPSSAPAT